MKQSLQKLFSPLLSRFEAGDQAYAYKPSHRMILLLMSAMFCSLAIAVLFVAHGQALSYLIPVLVFGGGGLFGLVIGFLGNDRAVAKIWGSR